MENRMQQEEVEFECYGTELIRYHGSQKQVVVPTEITGIGDSAFYGCVEIEEVILPENLMRIGRSSFAECPNLRSVKFNNGLSVLADAVFENCQSLEEVSLPDTVQYIGRMAFSKCASLRSVRMPDGLEVLSHGLFMGDVKLTKLQLPSQLRRIEDSVFYFCKALEEIEIPERVADIYPDTFYGCSGLKRGYVPGINLNFYRQEERLLFAMLYLSTKQQHTYWEQQIYESFIAEFKLLVCDKILQAKSYEALKEMIALELLSQAEMDSFIEQARRKGEIEFTAKLLQYKQEKFPQEADMWEI